MEKLTVGVLLGAYEASRFKNKAASPPLKSLDILSAAANAAAAIGRGQGAAKGVLLSRWAAEFAHTKFACVTEGFPFENEMALEAHSCL